MPKVSRKNPSDNSRWQYARAIRPSKKFIKTLEEFLDILCSINPSREKDLIYRNRGSYTYRIGPKFMQIIAPSHIWKLDIGSGNLMRWRTYAGPYGNIYKIVAGYKQGMKIFWDGDHQIKITGWLKD